MGKFLLEGCIENQQEANYYAKQEIDRLELCSHLDGGGLCPDISLVDYCLNTLKIDSVIMLRLRNDFSYQSSDYLNYQNLIVQYRRTGATQFIFGFLKDGEVDIEACQQLLGLLNGCDCAFHMAIDATSDYESSIEQVINLGFKWILTKGGNDKPAIDNLKVLKNIIATHSKKIKILVGGKVTSENWEKIAKETDATWFHGRKIK